MDEKQKDTTSRKWLLTINNPAEHGMTHAEIKTILSSIKALDYWCMSDEIGGKEKTYHTHLFLYRSSPIRFSRLKKLFPAANLQMARGTSLDCRNYIRKEGRYENSEKALTNLKDTFEECGECPTENQGQRNDLNTLYDMIKDGLDDFAILEENPQYMTRLDTIGRVRETLRYEQFSNCKREVHVEYWHGKPGSGKTSGVLNMHGFKDVYIVDDYKNPWDGYSGQDVVLFDEFDAARYDINKILRWLDIWPVRLPCRYNNKQACYTKVYFTSNKSFDEQYGTLKRNDSEIFNALTRRFHRFKVFCGDGSQKDYDSYAAYAGRWMDVDDNPFLKG